MENATHKGADLKVRVKAVFAGLALAASVVIVTGIFDRSERRLSQEEALHSATVFSNSLHEVLINSIHDRTVVVENVGAFWRAHPQKLAGKDFARYGRAILGSGRDQEHTGVRSLQLLKNGIVQFVYPLSSSAFRVGQDVVSSAGLKLDFEVLPSLPKFQDTVVLSGPLTLKSNKNQKVLIAQLALRGMAKDDMRLWGYAMAVVSLKPILQSLKAQIQGSGYDVAIRSLNGDGKPGSLFFGDESTFADGAVLRRIERPGLIWQIGLRPTQGWPVTAQLTPWFWLSGIILAVLSGSLLTRQIINNANLRAARFGAEKASRAKSAFLANMSHEFRTPLNAVIGYGDMLAHDLKGPLNAGQREYLAHMSDSAHHLLKLINQVLELSKIETGTLEVKLQALCVDETMAAGVSFVAAQAKQKNVTVKLVQGCGADKSIWADELLLRRALINLLGNAVKYNTRGGWVEISCAPLDSGYKRICVRDSGPGIAVRRQNHLFAPFERLSYDHSDLEGSGISLTITRSLIEAMGGRIGLESQEGIGSTFWVELPNAP